jgi:gliding motility-associated-like protein
MTSPGIKKPLFFSMLVLWHFTAVAQCPANIDFEYGNFQGWECKKGEVSTAPGSGANQVAWSSISSVPEFDRHELYGPSDTTRDQFGGFYRHCPNSSGFSVRLGNESTGKEAEGLSYTFTIPANNTKFALVYYYAIVLQDPGHNEPQQPRFRARVVDASSEEELNCVAFDFTASASLPGFQTSGGVVYRDWTPITVDLGAYAGRTVRLEFITSDCTLGGHFGYAYVDVNSTCTQIIEGTAFCNSDSSITLKGPFGFQSYEWYTDLTYSQIKATTQNITLNRNSVGSTYPLILVPFPGFGCRDTLYASIKVAVKPDADAGPDRPSCDKQGATLGGPPGLLNTYLWKPANYLSDAQAANPVVRQGLPGPTKFYVTVTDTSTGCYEIDSALITPVIVDTATTNLGRLVYCPSDNFNVTLSVKNANSIVQWYEGDGEIFGANTLTYKPTSLGDYWVRIFQDGCIDSSKHFIIKYTDFPTARFLPDKDVQCIKYPVHFINQTTYTGTAAPSYSWSFRDGNSSTDHNPENLFTVPGRYSVKLVASLFGCKDSIEKTVTIMKNCFPMVPTAFTPNNDGVNDRIKPVTPGLKTLIRFAVANRYGNFVFTTSKEGESWDGNIYGRQAPSGVYVWILEYIASDGSRQVEKGTVTLIR